MLRRNKAAGGDGGSDPAGASLVERCEKERAMTKDQLTGEDRAGGPGKAQPKDESLEAASRESVEFLEEEGEPGHAGRGDGG